MSSQGGGLALLSMLMPSWTWEAKAIMGMNALDALPEPGPLGMVGWKVIQFSAAPMVSNMPGFMPPLKVTPFIEGGHPDALLGVGRGAGMKPAGVLGREPGVRNWLEVLDTVEAEEALTASAVEALVVVAALLLDADVCDETSAVVDVVDKVLLELDAPVPLPGHGPWPRCT